MSGYEDVYLQVSSLPISQLSLRFLLSCDDICDVPIPYIFVLKKYSIGTYCDPTLFHSGKIGFDSWLQNVSSFFSRIENSIDTKIQKNDRKSKNRKQSKTQY